MCGSSLHIESRNGRVNVHTACHIAWQTRAYRLQNMFQGMVVSDRTQQVQ
jgi:hypothetical protein